MQLTLRMLQTNINDILSEIKVEVAQLNVSL